MGGLERLEIDEFEMFERKKNLQWFKSFTKTL